MAIERKELIEFARWLEKSGWLTKDWGAIVVDAWLVERAMEKFEIPEQDPQIVVIDHSAIYSNWNDHGHNIPWPE